MFGKKTEPLSEKKEKILKSYEKINDNFVYRTVKSMQEAREFQKEEVSVLQQAGVTVVLLVNNGQPVTHLAPGQDPYQARQQIDSFFKAQKQKSQATKTTDKTPPKKTATKTSSGVRVEKTVSI